MSGGDWLIACVQLAQSGDADAEDEIARWLLDWAQSRLGKLGEDGEDLAGIFAMRMIADGCRRLAGLRPGAEPDAYLAEALRNVLRRWRSLESRRRERCEYVADLEALEHTDPSPAAADPLALLMADEEQRALWAAVRGLSEEHKQFVRMRLDGWTHRDIADALGISPASARKRWDRITEQLHRCLAD